MIAAKKANSGDMKPKFFGFILLGLFSLIEPMNSPAQQANGGIKPFGDLAWDDSFTSVVQKVKRWPGLTKCEASRVFSQVDLLHIASTKEIERVPERVLGLQFESVGKVFGAPSHFPK